MNSHFCKVGKISPNPSKITNLKDLEHKYSNFIEEAYNVEQTDRSLSDTLFHEAKKLKQRILNLKKYNPTGFDAAF
ncbi:Lacal_2735 family protein [Psychroserpens damuponensis]|uniref:Lacal_2735 family protein n=1 Tax=Psychroserpens damuponensis TaxID=943936 RepID=UPI00058F6253|nr:Lacal_2735 family protein [Psychroserpens damuponensis]